MLIALLEGVVGGILIYSAFQKSPDPRKVIQEFFSGKGKKAGRNPGA